MKIFLGFCTKLLLLPLLLLLLLFIILELAWLLKEQSTKIFLGTYRVRACIYGRRRTLNVPYPRVRFLFSLPPFFSFPFWTKAPKNPKKHPKTRKRCSPLRWIAAVWTPLRTRCGATSGRHQSMVHQRSTPIRTPATTTTTRRRRRSPPTSHLFAISSPPSSYTSTTWMSA